MSCATHTRTGLDDDKRMRLRASNSPCSFAEPLCANATPKLAALGRMGHQAACYIGPRPRAGNNRRCRMTRPSPKQVKAMAEVTGVPVRAEEAERIANSIGPAFEGFAVVAGTLPFDLEPATFLLVQAGKFSR